MRENLIVVKYRKRGKIYILGDVNNMRESNSWKLLKIFFSSLMYIDRVENLLVMKLGLIFFCLMLFFSKCVCFFWGFK